MDGVYAGSYPMTAIMHEQWMHHALVLADRAANLGEVPVGAIVVHGGRIIGEGHNCPISTSDPTAHAEIIALRQAANKLGNYRLVHCSLYVTLEPCTMCVGAMVHSRIKHLFFGAPEPKAGAVKSQMQLLDACYHNHRVAYEGGICEALCAQRLTDFFVRRRQAAAYSARGKLAHPP